MDIIPRFRVVKIKDGPHLDWSFKPLFDAMRIFGIDLHLRCQSSTIRRCTFVIMGTIMCLWMASSNLSQPYHESPPLNIASTKHWLNFMLKYTWWAWYIAVPLATLEMVTHFKWKHLRKTMQDMEESAGFSQVVCYTLRRVCIALVSYSFISVTN